MSILRRRLLPAAVSGLLLLGCISAGVGLAERDDDAPRSDPPAAGARGAAAAVTALGFDPASVPAAVRFLDGYVDPDGRVVRRDQGGDTVSEGQAYALLVAVGLGDRARFDLVWRWTDAHLQRPDGLLSWRWADGRVVDEQPAADADLDAAWALALADRAWPDSGYGEAASSLAEAIAADETLVLDGRRILAAGPWAVAAAEDGEPLVVNPSYASPVAVDVLASGGHLRGFGTGARGSGDRAVVERLVAAHGAPPDWASIAADGSVAPSDPRGGTGSGFGWDAVRVPLRYAPSCADDDRAVAAAIWPAMEAGAGVDAMGDHPARLVGAAAAAAAHGDAERGWSLLREAIAAEAAATTYYGAALTALGQLALTTDRLLGCPPLTPG